MVETYTAMWEMHGIPGRVARNPVDMSKWIDVPRNKSTKQPKPMDAERKAKRAARRAASKKANES